LLNIIFLRIILLNITVKTKYENLHQKGCWLTSRNCRHARIISKARVTNQWN
jgi:hypothetical protein